ncbi:hypothetical protein SK128_027768 [Halocaridina rubra]|uniref:Uncharacterized protein n=1 Tax=Halocaridina rubra TaxID=373956 RepID=A0AAN8ZVT7_HALRR
MERTRWGNALPLERPGNKSLMQDILDVPCRLSSDSRYSISNTRSVEEPPAFRPPGPLYPRNVSNIPQSDGSSQYVQNDSDALYLSRRRDFDGGRLDSSYGPASGSSNLFDKIQSRDYEHGLSRNEPHHSKTNSNAVLPSMHQFLSSSDYLQYSLTDSRSDPSSVHPVDQLGTKISSMYGSQQRSNERLPSMQETLKTSKDIMDVVIDKPQSSTPMKDNESLMSDLMLLEMLTNITKTKETPIFSQMDTTLSSASNPGAFWESVSEQLQKDKSKYKRSLSETSQFKTVLNSFNRKQDFQHSAQYRVPEDNFKDVDEYSQRSKMAWNDVMIRQKKESSPIIPSSKKSAFRDRSISPDVGSRSRNRSPDVGSRSRNRSPDVGRSWRYERKSSRLPDRYKESSYRSRSRSMSPKGYRSRSPVRRRSPEKYGSRSSRDWSPRDEPQSRDWSPERYPVMSPLRRRSKSPRKYRTPTRSSSPPWFRMTTKPSMMDLESFSPEQIIGALHLVNCAIKLSRTPYLLTIFQHDVSINLSYMPLHQKKEMFTEGFELRLNVVPSVREEDWKKPLTHLIDFALETEQFHEIYVEARAHEDELDIRYAKPFELAEYIRGANTVIAFMSEEALRKRELANKKKKKKK